MSIGFYRKFLLEFEAKYIGEEREFIELLGGLR